MTKRAYFKISTIAGFGLIWILLFWYFDILHFLSFESIQQNGNVIREYVHNNLVLYASLYVVAYILIAALSIPVATSITLLGGYIFGLTVSVILVNIGSSVGALCAFLFARFLFRDYFEKKYKGKIDYFNKKLEANSTLYLLFVRLIPVFPFFIVNILAGLTRTKSLKFYITTSIGTLPVTILYCYAGTSLQSLKSPSDILTPKIMSILLGSALILLILGYIAKRSLKISNRKI